MSRGEPPADPSAARSIGTATSGDREFDLPDGERCSYLSRDSVHSAHPALSALGTPPWEGQVGILENSDKDDKFQIRMGCRPGHISHARLRDRVGISMSLVIVAR